MESGIPSIQPNDVTSVTGANSALVFMPMINNETSERSAEPKVKSLCSAETIGLIDMTPDNSPFPEI